MIIDHRDNDNYLELARTNQIPLGLGLGIPLDENLRFKRGNFNIILGHANTGKTYWVLWYLLAHSVNNKLKHLIYSSENSVNGIKRNLIELYSGSKIVGMDSNKLDKCKKFIESHFDFVDTSKRLYEITDFMKEVQKMGRYDSLMIDPHNSFLAPRGVNKHDHDYEVASRLRLYAKTNKTTIFLCTHASTEALRKVHPKQHDKEGMPIPPNSADAEGGGKWVNRADDFLVIHRYTQSPNDWMFTEVHVKKVKETESGGKPTFLNEPVMFKLEEGTKFMNGGVNAILK
jgi:hypothetical protein